MKYKCIYPLCLPKFDDDGFDTDKYGSISIGSIWKINNETNIIGGEVHLDKISEQTNNKTNEQDCFTWIEISKETLSKAFKEIE